jgi:hypothetical protein
MDKGSAVLQLSLAAFRNSVIDRLAALSRLYVAAYSGLACFITD